MRFKGAIFDLDGTLTLTQKFHLQSFRTVFQKFGIPYDAATDFYYAGIGSRITVGEMLKKHGITNADIDQCLNEKKRIYEELLRTEKIEPVPGIENVLQRFHAKQIPTVVASGNKKEFVETILNAAKLQNLFSFVITNNDVKRGKPAPDIFLEAAKRMGMEAKDCIVFEDAWSGIQAAKAAGMFCVGLATMVSKEKLLEEGVNLAITDYHELPDEILA